MSDPVFSQLMQSRDDIFARLFSYLQIPSVSTDEKYLDDMARARTLLSNWLSEWGFSNVQELDEGGHPCVYAEWLNNPGAPTYLVYGHYDVQPADPVELWSSPAFVPQIRDERIYARGVSDDKGPTMIALETLSAFLKVEGKLPVNVKILLEGEEENGSATLEKICTNNRDLLSADAALSADGARWRADVPSLNVGNRGNCGLEFSIEAANRDLHSGRFGGAIPNALHVMADLLSELHKPDGSIAVPGFYDSVSPPDEQERKAIADLPFDETEFFADLGTAPFGEQEYHTLERLWLRPTLEINGMWGGYIGQGTKTVTPAKASAKLTMRLVQGQDPDDIVEKTGNYLKTQCPDGVDLTIDQIRGGARAYEVPAELPLFKAAQKALEQTRGQKPLLVRTGSTLPLSDIIRKSLGLETVMFSFSTADENFHSPDEFMRLSAFDEGFEAWTRLLRIAGKTS